MTPSIDERLASVIRALSDVVLAALPSDAALAQEQVQLSIGHLQILRAQYDLVPAYEADELVDALALARALGGCSGGPRTGAACAALDAARGEAGVADDPAAVRAARIALNAAIAALVGAVGDDGEADSRVLVSRTILDHEKRRVLKDRRWFAPFGFDGVPAEA